MNWAANIWGRFAGTSHNSGPGTESKSTMATITKIASAGQPAAGTVHWFNECVERSKSGVFSEVVTVTPGLASAILQRNENNRNVRKVKAAHYANDMARGRWTFNGEPIIIADTGDLNDGQHRLYGVIDANTPLPFLFVFGLPRESRLTVDQGGARTAGDYLAMGSMKNASTVAGVARLIMAYEAEDGRNLNRAHDYTNAQIVERVNRDDDLHPAAEYAQSVAKYAKGLLIPSLSGAAFYILSEINAEQAREYLNKVIVGENIKRGDPAFAVRNALTNLERSSKSDRLEMVFRGWNAMRQGRKLTLAKSLGTFPALV